MDLMDFVKTETRVGERISRPVPAHQTEMLKFDGWTFWRVRTGCIRVQRGDTTAYLQADEAMDLADFIRETNRPEWPES